MSGDVVALKCVGEVDGVALYSDACTCPSPETDWAPEQRCGGISTQEYSSRTGKPIGPPSEPPLCETHMKPWGHRRGCPIHDQRALPTPIPDQHDHQED